MSNENGEPGVPEIGDIERTAPPTELGEFKRAAAHAKPPLLALVARAYGRFVAPLTLLSLVALAPILFLALRAPAPTDAAHAKALGLLAYELALVAWIFQLVLVGGAAPAARALVEGAHLSQWRALRDGVVQLVRASLPCLAVAGAVVIGGLALVAPGALALVLLSMTGAATDRGMPAPLEASVAAARPQLGAVAITVGAMLLLDVALAYAATKIFAGAIPVKAPSLAQLATAQRALKIFALALAALSPIPATALATLFARHHAPRA